MKTPIKIVKDMITKNYERKTLTKQQAKELFDPQGKGTPSIKPKYAVKDNYGVIWEKGLSKKEAELKAIKLKKEWRNNDE